MSLGSGGQTAEERVAHETDVEKLRAMYTDVSNDRDAFQEAAMQLRQEMLKDEHRFSFLAKHQIRIQEYKGRYSCFGGSTLFMTLGYYHTIREAIDAAITAYRSTL